MKKTIIIGLCLLDLALIVAISLLCFGALYVYGFPAILGAIAVVAQVAITGWLAYRLASYKESKRVAGFEWAANTWRTGWIAKRAEIEAMQIQLDYQSAMIKDYQESMRERTEALKR